MEGQQTKKETTSNEKEEVALGALPPAKIDMAQASLPMIIKASAMRVEKDDDQVVDEKAKETRAQISGSHGI